VRFTEYFQNTRRRSDRKWIETAWIERVVNFPEREEIQVDGRIRRWARMPEAGNQYLRVVLLEDRETVHNAFFDRSFTG